MRYEARVTALEEARAARHPGEGIKRLNQRIADMIERGPRLEDCELDDAAPIAVAAFALDPATHPSPALRAKVRELAQRSNGLAAKVFVEIAGTFK